MTVQEAELKSPYPWFGGKSLIAAALWRRLGDVKCYVEPFFGSGAALLARPQPFDGVETISDLDGLVCNFWRAVRKDPDAVAEHADWPVIENDLHARHAWLVGQKDSLQARLEGDPEFCDTKIAGWWVWGMSLWIGGEFCSGRGPWAVREGQLVHLGDAGRGVNRKLVHLGDAGRGVNRKLVHLGNAGRGVSRRLVHLHRSRGVKGVAGQGERGIREWMRALAARLERVRVACGDWTRVCGGASGDAIQHFFAAGEPVGIFLDPPYSDEAGRDTSIYRQEDLEVAHAVRDWALRHGDDPRLRIALCGYEEEHEMPRAWTRLRWKARGGMANQRKRGENRNRHREVVWFSPHCVDRVAARQLELFQ
jgi:site-specific DNA-adenine methylase